MRKVIVIFILTFSFISGFSQPGGGPGGGGDPGHGKPVPIPGLEILLASGAIVGIKYFRQRKNKTL